MEGAGQGVVGSSEGRSPYSQRGEAPIQWGVQRGEAPLLRRSRRVENGWSGGGGEGGEGGRAAGGESSGAERRKRRGVGGGGFTLIQLINTYNPAHITEVKISCISVQFVIHSVHINNVG